MRTLAALALMAGHAAAQCTPEWIPAPAYLTGAVRVLGSWDPDGPRPAVAMLLAASDAPSQLVTWDGVAWVPIKTAWLGVASALTEYNSQLVAGSSLGAVASFDGSTWTQLGVQGGRDYSFAEFQDRLIVGTEGGVYAFDPQSGWTHMGTSNGTTRALAVFQSQLIAAIYAGGISFWTGSGWQQMGDSSRSGRALAVFSGELYASDSSRGIVRWDGAAWQLIGPTDTSGVETLIVYGPDLIAGGRFTAIGGVPARSLAAFDGAHWRSLGFVAPVWRDVYTLAVHEGDLMVGGFFSSPFGENIARWHCTPCYANCDQSPAASALNVNDFVCFQSRYAAGDPYADCDQTGSLNVNDFVCFQGRFAAGCP